MKTNTFNPKILEVCMQKRVNTCVSQKIYDIQKTISILFFLKYLFFDRQKYFRN